MIGHYVRMAAVAIVVSLTETVSHAAESVDEAVEQVAQKFVASRLGLDESMRVAVTSFIFV